MADDPTLALARSFPLLRDAPGVRGPRRIDPCRPADPEFYTTIDGVRCQAGEVRPFNAAALDKWSKAAGITRQARHAARFVLSVWDSTNRWKAGPFNVHAALAAWDDEHREAFAAWAARPWWP